MGLARKLISRHQSARKIFPPSLSAKYSVARPGSTGPHANDRTGARESSSSAGLDPVKDDFSPGKKHGREDVADPGVVLAAEPVDDLTRRYIEDARGLVREFML